MLLRKTTKKDIIGSVLIKSPPELKGSVFIYGRIGSGKTTAMLSLAQRYRDILNYKIVDLFGGHRNENLYWCLPSRDVNYWDKIKKMISARKDQEGSKQYNVNLLYPLFTKQLPKKLPANPPYVKSKLFTIPFRDISFDEIKLVINNVTEPMKYYWNEILDRSNKKTLIVEVEELIYKLKAEKTNLYRSFIKPLVGEGFLQSEKCSYNIDILGEMKDKNTVTVLCLDFISPTYHLFIMNYFLRKVKEYLDKGRLSTKNIFLFREVSDFFKTSDDSIMEDKFKYFRRLLSMYIRYSRRGMHFFLETQSPWEVRSLVEGSQDLTFLGRISATSRRDRAEIAEALYSVGKIEKYQINQLGELRSGESFLIEGTKPARKIYIFLPRTMYWKEGDGNFYNNLWKKYVDKWVNIEIDKNNMKEEIEQARKILKEKLKSKEESKKKRGKKKETTDEMFEEDRYDNITETIWDEVFS